MTGKHTINDVTPYPKTAEDATADAMARHFTAFAQLHWRLAMDHPDREKARQSVNMFTNCYGIAYLLREQPASEADRVAKELWETWDSGVGVGVDVWNWLIDDYGIDPHAINQIAAQYIAEDEPKSEVETEPVHAGQSELPLEGA